MLSDIADQSSGHDSEAALTSPVISKGVQGKLDLRFDIASATGRTRLQVREQRAPLQAVRAFPIGNGGALVHLHNVSGGVLGGDQLALNVEVGHGAYAQLTSTGATRVYRTRQEAPPSLQSIEVHVEQDAVLEYLPDPLIPFAGARYVQQTRIALGENAGLFWWDIIAPGREAHGELFAYELLESSLEVTAFGIPIVLEQFRLEPALRPLDSPGRLGAYRYFCSFAVCRVGVSSAVWSALESELNALARQLSASAGGRDEVVWGASTLPAHGILVRGVARKGRNMMPGLLAFWQAARRTLYNSDAVPPRKVY